MTFVITSCTNRKRRPVSPQLRMMSLASARLDEVARDWGRRLENESERFLASEIYGGRSFQEARTAATAINAQLLVVSAGLGLVDAGQRVPPYACTVLVDAEDSVRARVVDGFEIPKWWKALRATSPFARPLEDRLSGQSGLILAALSDAYLDMLADELVALPQKLLGRLRIFTRAPEARILQALRPFVMPYDDRLDGPDSHMRGTRSDFAARALRHYVDLGLGRSEATSTDKDADVIRAAISTWQFPAKFERKRLDDAAIILLLEEHWDHAGGSGTKLLRYFRDELDIACEQSRFAGLVRLVREKRS